MVPRMEAESIERLDSAICAISTFQIDQINAKKNAKRRRDSHDLLYALSSYSKWGSWKI